METFVSKDGTRLAYHKTGTGRPLVVFPGGPMQSAEYLGDLGGLPSLVLLDPRGTGGSEAPADEATYRCDRQAADLEALREHLGLDQLDLAAHSAGAAVVLQYVQRYPERIRKLVLINPSPFAAGITVTDEQRRAVAEQRRGEPWFEAGFAALEKLWAGEHEGVDFSVIQPFVHGRWDAAAQHQVALGEKNRNSEAAGIYYAEGGIDPDAVRAALTALPAPVLLVVGSLDIQLPGDAVDTYRRILKGPKVARMPAGGHFSFVDDPEWFARTVSDFLAE